MTLRHHNPASAWQGYNIVLDQSMQRRGKQALERKLVESVEHLQRYPVVNLNILELHYITAGHACILSYLDIRLAMLLFLSRLSQPCGLLH